VAAGGGSGSSFIMPGATDGTVSAGAGMGNGQVGVTSVLPVGVTGLGIQSDRSGADLDDRHEAIRVSAGAN
jgi:hypothetical protein